MKKIANKPFMVSLLLCTVLACTTVKEQVKTSPQEKKGTSSVEISAESEAAEDVAADQVTGNIEDSKTALIFNVSSCSWSYIDEHGKLQAVSIIDGKPQYVSSGEIHYINLDKTGIVFK